MAAYLQEMMNQGIALLSLVLVLLSNCCCMLFKETISVITNDGRNIIGVLKGFDQCVNVILDDSFERVFSLREPVEAVELGLYIVRGDNISVIGGVPENIREQVIDDQTRAAPLKPLVH